MGENGTKTVVFNVRGTKFETAAANFDLVPGSILVGLDKASIHYNEQKQEYFFDRDPDAFKCILNIFSHGELHVPKNMCMKLFREEMAFWGIPHRNIADCCWRTFFQIDEDMGIVEEFRTVYQHHFEDPEEKNLNAHEKEKKQRLKSSRRYKIWLIMDQPKSSFFAKMWHCFYLLTVLLSSSLLCLWTLDELRTDHYMTNIDVDKYPALRDSANSKMTQFFLADPALPLFILDAFCLIVFIVEFVLHFSTCYQKIQFMKEPLNVVSLLVVTIMFIAFVMEFEKGHMADNGSARLVYFVCKAFTMLRLLLFFRLEKQFGALRVLLMSLKASLIELLLMAITFMIATIIFASLIYFAEIETNETEVGMHGIFISMWWAIITMTTVGYGDFYPTTTAGYLVGVACAVCGLMLLAMPIAIIASNFTDYYIMHKDIERVIKIREEQNREKHSANGTIKKITVKSSNGKVSPFGGDND